jgi:hypothetical protein
MQTLTDETFQRLNAFVLNCPKPSDGLDGLQEDLKGLARTANTLLTSHRGGSCADQDREKVKATARAALVILAAHALVASEQVV